MDSMVSVIMTILAAAKIGGVAGATWCFTKVAYKCFWSKESFKESKNDALAGCIGLVVLLGSDKIATWLQSTITF